MADGIEYCKTQKGKNRAAVRIDHLSPPPEQPHSIMSPLTHTFSFRTGVKGGNGYGCYWEHATILLSRTSIYHYMFEQRQGTVHRAGWRAESATIATRCGCVFFFASLFAWCIHIAFVGVDFAPDFFGLFYPCPFLFLTVLMTFTRRHFCVHRDCLAITAGSEGSAAPISRRPLKCTWFARFTQTPPTRRHQSRQTTSRKARGEGERNRPSAPKGRKADKRKKKGKTKSALCPLFSFGFVSFSLLCTVRLSLHVGKRAAC